MICLTAFVLIFASAIAQDIKTAYHLDETLYPVNLPQNAALKNFVKVVEANKMNVSVIISIGINFKEGNHLKNVIAMTVSFPPNSERLTKSEFNKEQGKNFIKTATEEHLAAKVLHVEDNGQTRGWSNKPEGVPLTESHRLLTTIKNGRAGFFFNESNYAAQYVFITPGADGQNKTTKILLGNIDVEFTGGSDNVEEKEIERIKELLPTVYFMFSEDIRPKALVIALEKNFPGQNWQVAVGVGENSYFEEKKWLSLRMLDVNYLIYTI